jgi:peptidyl-Lys metalloendopeptidase
MKQLGKLSAALALALLASGAALAKPSTLEISLAPTSAKADDGSGKLRYTIRNNGSVDVLVLAWETPLRGVEDDLFDVTLDGKPVEYVGRHFKRGLPRPEDYVELEAGQALSVDVDLSEHYDMRAAGSYSAQALAHFHDSFAVHPKSRAHEKLVALSDRDLRSDVVQVWVDGVALDYSNDAGAYGVLDLAKAGSVAYVGCSNTRQSQISSGLSAARTMSSGANSYLSANKQGTRYTTWFGAYNATRYSTLRSNFTKITDALNNKPLVFDCSTCTQSAYAYVYPNQPYRVYLCSAYWSAPTSGTDSKGGTTIHELSHFDVVANTDDLAYGQAACKRLTATKAIRNADSHEYFGENTPPLN